MIELHITSLCIGMIIGCLVGIAVSFFVAWQVEAEMNIKRNNRFSDGWDAGIEYHKAIMEKEALNK